MAKDKLICNCNRTMPLDGKALARALKLESAPAVHTELCRKHIAAFEAAVKKGDDLVVACTQEAPLFGELHGELKGNAGIQFVNIRETAGWSAEAKNATPKIAALLAAADLPDPEPVPVVSYRSGGSLLVIGPGPAALEWADRLSEQLSVSVLVTADAERHELPAVRGYPVFSGMPGVVTGYLGAFQVEWEQANPIDLETCTRCNACIRVCPEQAIDFSYQIDLGKCKAHRQCVKACGEIGAIDFERKETQRSDAFDLVLDLSREPLIRSPQPPQGYFAPGRDPLRQALAAQELTQHVGEFEKPKYFEYREKICAHGRSEIVGCTRCIDVCSTRAITSELEQNRIKVEPHLCMGCGGCATVCPSGAMTYAYPRVADLGTRIKTVLQVYREAGGEGACLLFHNTTDGRELVARMARRGKGLPARVIPLEVFHIASLGLDLMLGSIALGAARFIVLSTGSEPSGYHDAIERQMGLARAILSGLGLDGERFQLIKAGTPAELETAVWTAASPRTLSPATFNLTNEKRTTLDFVFDHLLRHAPQRKDEVALPAGAPYGAVLVDGQKCTMCLACVGACPEGALLDAKDKPQLRFIERNCVQCGLCEKTCPEDAIALAPRLLLAPSATHPAVLNEDRIFACVRCGKPFANQRIIDNMLGKLAAHAMFRDPKALRRLQMCQDCRVVDMFEKADSGNILDETAKE
ncbi:MAG: 4Fe-4S binding protein [Betaproteobacteria bacterium]|nr:4Fe-4S binding protein [Betaproteobacteria bacterium]